MDSGEGIAYHTDQQLCCLSKTSPSPRSEEPCASIIAARLDFIAILPGNEHPGPWAMVHDAYANVCARPNLSVARPAMVGSSGETQPRRAFETNQD